MAQAKPVDFEKKIKELETIVERMQSKELSLEEALCAFEQGVALSQSCQQTLTTAEQTVKNMLKKQNDS